MYIINKNIILFYWALFASRPIQSPKFLPSPSFGFWALKINRQKVCRRKRELPHSLFLFCQKFWVLFFAIFEKIATI